MNPDADATVGFPGGGALTPPMPAIQRVDSSQHVNKVFEDDKKDDKKDVPVPTTQPWVAPPAAGTPAKKAKVARGSRLNPNATDG